MSKDNKGRRFERVDFVMIDDQLELLLMINQSRFDKGELSIQEEAEILAVNKILKKIEVEQKCSVLGIFDKWFYLSEHKNLTDNEIVELFNDFVSKIMTENHLFLMRNETVD